ncbi:CobB/CobQ-like glutamine amidotransferase domain-containing protein [Schizothecium vesticola]|uniref:Phosphoribosylformylglycinamidine synthase n=1 Tax=Schizothecium vesticola TaxID=314040 RepID=A0AA40K5Y9_9PEZI|nr:CobB/CobQ-like glutamine amidotransferase domain-containing protein [Schizothecium vesticola]
MACLTLVGESCFTPSEAQKLKTLINKTAPIKVAAISGVWVYYARIDGDAAAAQQQLSQLLPLPSESATATAYHNPNSGHDRKWYIAPRYNSPWSTKATSIAHVCGMDKTIHRIERGRTVAIEFEQSYNDKTVPFRDVLHDRMTETMAEAAPDLSVMFAEGQPQPLEVVDIFAAGQTPVQVLNAYNKQRGLALDPSEVEYLVERFTQLGRPPHDIELFMFAQVNSEHCRHKQFNANWTIDGISKPQSLFDMIRNTHKVTPDYTVSAYSDNAAVMEGIHTNFWAPDYSTGSYKLSKELVHVLAKVETHNHPTAIAPFPGAATGSGGEIRDEGAVGRGSMPKAGLCGFWVSDLHIPDHQVPWEIDVGRPGHYASSIDIMREAPIGSAQFNNEFGRPNIVGSFRTLSVPDSAKVEGEFRGYHKPIMIAGGLGTVREKHALKNPEDVHEGAHVIVLGGPAMLIGLGGGAASSNASGEGNADLDFDSVQRGNPEMERRAQMVINTCVALGAQNPIAMIHDVGAGGLSNALPELVKDAGFGGRFELRQVESVDRSMSPLQIWCNEAQERYVILVNSEGMERFTSICRRERCGFSDVGTVLSQESDGVSRLVLADRESKEYPEPINVPMDVLFPKGRKLERIVESKRPSWPTFDAAISLKAAIGESVPTPELIKQAVKRVFWMPAVGSKSFLITIGDRSVGGLTVRDQMVGPWQTPVADVGVTASAFALDGVKTGEAMAMGEKPTLALISPAASARMAVAESLLNLGAADIKGGAYRGDLKRVKLSANWMAAVNHPGEGAALFEAVEAIGLDLCPRLGVSIPVGKDSTSMKASWKDGDLTKSMTAPVTVVITAFTLVEDIRSTWTPQLRRVEDVGETVLMFVDLAQGHKAMGGSAFAQSLGAIGHECPDVRDADLLKDYFDAMAQLHEESIVLAYHDRSDGGLLTTVAEMMFAGRCGVELSMDGVADSDSLVDMTEALFNEELGAVFQIKKSDEINFKKCFATCGPPAGLIKKVGVVKPTSNQELSIRYGEGKAIVTLDRAEMQQWWTKTSYEMQKLRDTPACAESEYATVQDSNDPGLSYNLTFSPSENIAPLTASITGFFGKSPRVAILREQGVNGYAEMAFAFRAAGFDAIDVHMSDIKAGRSLADFVGLAACGGFSYGDVLGAGQGWAKSILLEDKVRQELAHFFQRKDTFSLGVCNGCQMLSRLRDQIPGAEHWPTFVANRSAQFEARYSMVRIEDNPRQPSVFFNGMDGSSLPIVVSHGEGRAEFASPEARRALTEAGGVLLRYVDNRLKVTEEYPFNPNGSPEGVAGVSSRDGRVLVMMPHPERTIMADVGSYLPPGQLGEWKEFGPWLRMFRSARRWVG